MIRVRSRDGTDPPEVLLLEEISPQGVVISGDRPILSGGCLDLSADGFESAVTITSCDVREDAYVLRCEFSEGYCWNPQLWTPAHLYEVKGVPKAKSAGAS
jgi:hypothetical protein